MTEDQNTRICSLLPSATEIVFALGLEARLVGVTHECDYPPAARRLPVVTQSVLGHENRDSRDIHRHISAALHEGSSLYMLHQDLLERLDPELILTQELCDVCAVSYQLVQDAVLRLQGKRRVLSLEPTTLGGILTSIEQVGAATGSEDRAASLVSRLRERIETVGRTAGMARGRRRVLAVEWLDPLFMAGHWVPEMVRLAGGRDVLGVEGQPSRQITWPQAIEADPEVVVLMPCGFSLDQTIAEAASMRFEDEWRRRTGGRLPAVYAVNGSAYFNRPGPRIVDGLEMLFEIVQPELAPPRWAGTGWRRLA